MIGHGDVHDPVVIDRQAPQEGACYYRMVATSIRVGNLIFGPIQVAGSAGAAAFALMPVAPAVDGEPARISFRLPRAARIRIAVHDVSGRRAHSIVDAHHPAGEHEIVWHPVSAGRPLASGIFFVRLAWPGGSSTRRLVLIR